MNGVVTGYGVFVELADSVMFKRNTKVFESLCLCANSGKQLNKADGLVYF